MSAERLTEADVLEAFQGTDFGGINNGDPKRLRHLLALSVLKKALRYHCGHTVTQIMVRQGLTTAKGRVTERGRLFCYEALDAGKSA